MPASCWPVRADLLVAPAQTQRPYSLSMMGEVAPQGRDDEMASAAQLRASHDDRDRVVEVLRIAAGDGRLTAEELDERLESALQARTIGELAALITDLPAGSSAVIPMAATVEPLPQPKEVARIDCRSGSAKRDGRWVVPRRLEVRVTSGHVRLDFTQAVIVHRSIQIDADVRSGQLTIVTRPGIVVDTDDVTVRSGHVRVRAPWVSTSPLPCWSASPARSAAVTSPPTRPGAPSGSGCAGDPGRTRSPPAEDRGFASHHHRTVRRQAVSREDFLLSRPLP